MSVRSCQFCGKPLSRLRVGGDGDFCSREHRNQHRLRCGMDRLEEANKVTSLMRRRENPRHISPARLMCNSALERRGFLEPKPLASGAAIASLAPVLRGPAAPRVTGADRYLSPRASRLLASDAPRAADTSRTHIRGRGTLPLVPPRRRQLPAQIVQAPPVRLNPETPARAAAPRIFGMARPRQIHAHLGTALTQDARQQKQAPALPHPNRLQKIQCVPIEGNALRVSIGIGFRAPAAKAPTLSRTPAPAGLVWPRAPQRVAPPMHDSPAAPRELEFAIRKFRARLPEVPAGTRRTQFVFPGKVAPRRQEPAAGVWPPTRSTDVPWKPPEPLSRRLAVAPPAAGFATRNGAHAFTIGVTPKSSRPPKQVALAAFVPREPVGYPKVAFEGTVAAAIVSSPAGTPAGAEPAAPQSAAPARMVRIEEHFGSGWDNWMGGTREWLVDVAGVRTGPLALFVPTLELIDYELDFLARIDTRSITWVVRANGLDEHQRCTLTALEGGELEFSRRAVVAGAVEPPVTAVQRLPGKRRSAMTLSTRVLGSTFTVSVDGKTIDSWNDDRFPMGGIGFIGTPDDRARLYWVRISSTESIAKEHRKK